MRQLTLAINTNLTDSYSSCRELIAARVHQQGRPQKSIAADMDLSPSDLSRKLAENEGDPRCFKLGDFEKYLEVTQDPTPLRYLLAKYSHLFVEDE